MKVSKKNSQYKLLKFYIINCKVMSLNFFFSSNYAFSFWSFKSNCYCSSSSFSRAFFSISCCSSFIFLRRSIIFSCCLSSSYLRFILACFKSTFFYTCSSKSRKISGLVMAWNSSHSDSKPVTIDTISDGSS